MRVRIFPKSLGRGYEGGGSSYKVMPDYLHRAAPAYGSITRDGATVDPDLAAERSWLESSLRCYLDNALLGDSKACGFHDSLKCHWSVSDAIKNDCP
jgi:hypothetical protein